MSLTTKKSYNKPELTTYGGVEKLTMNGHLSNSDGQGANTALPNP